jgi:hypothetical protein
VVGICAPFPSSLAHVPLWFFDLYFWNQFMGSGSCLFPLARVPFQIFDLAWNQSGRILPSSLAHVPLWF